MNCQKEIVAALEAEGFEYENTYTEETCGLVINGKKFDLKVCLNIVYAIIMIQFHCLLGKPWHFVLLLYMRWLYSQGKQ